MKSHDVSASLIGTTISLNLISPLANDWKESEHSYSPIVQLLSCTVTNWMVKLDLCFVTWVRKTPIVSFNSVSLRLFNSIFHYGCWKCWESCTETRPFPVSVDAALSPVIRSVSPPVIGICRVTARLKRQELLQALIGLDTWIPGNSSDESGTEGILGCLALSRTIGQENVEASLPTVVVVNAKTSGIPKDVLQPPKVDVDTPDVDKVSKTLRSLLQNQRRIDIGPL